MSINTLVSLENLENELENLKSNYKGKPIQLSSNEENASITLEVVALFTNETIYQKELATFDVNNDNDMSLWNLIYDKYNKEFEEIVRGI